MRYSTYSVRHLGVPVGTVALAARELSAGPLLVAQGYAAIQQTVRDGSETLLQLGFFGAAARAIETPTEALAATLSAAALLTFELHGPSGEEIPTTFINLIELPGDSRVVVLARFSHAPARVGAITPAPVGESPFGESPDGELPATRDGA